MHKYEDSRLGEGHRQLLTAMHELKAQGNTAPTETDILTHLWPKDTTAGTLEIVRSRLNTLRMMGYVSIGGEIRRSVGTPWFEYIWKLRFIENEPETT